MTDKAPNPPRAQRLIARYEARQAPEDRVSDACKRYIDTTIKALVKPYPAKLKRWFKVGYTLSTTSEWDVFDRVLRLSTGGLDGSVADADEWIDASNKPGFAVGSGLEALVTHEFGHVLNAFIVAMADDELKDEWFDAKRAALPSMPYPSEYSRQNENEHFAELFAHEVLVSGKGELHTLIDTFMQKLKAAGRVK